MEPMSTVLYKGNLRTEALHMESGNRICTDAPKDNEGKGEAFSPTDLVATSLASCMITVMGIKSRQHGIDMDGTKAEVVKEMGSNPRRISTIRIKIKFPHNYSDKEKRLLERSALTCPVGKSLNSDLNEEIGFIYPE